MNDPDNNYYAAFTLDDYTDLDLDVGKSIDVSGITNLPFEMVTPKLVDYPEADNGPITITALGTGNTPYTLNSKKLYSMSSIDPFGASQKDEKTYLYHNGRVDDPEEGVTYPNGIPTATETFMNNLSHNTPYMFKTYADFGISNTDGRNGPTTCVGLKLHTSQDGSSANENDYWLIMNADGWDTGATAPSTYGKVYYKTREFIDVFNYDIHQQVGLTYNSDGIQQFPAINVTRTQDVTGVDFGDVVGFHNWQGVNGNHRDMDTQWDRLSGSLQLVQGDSELFRIGNNKVAVRRFIIPKLSKYTINNLEEIRPYCVSPTANIDALTVVVDDTITTNNPWYGYFNSGDIIEHESGQQYMLVKMHQEGTQMTISDDTWGTDIDGTIGVRYFNTNDYTSHNHSTVDIEAEEWCMYKIYATQSPTATTFADLLTKDTIIESYTPTMNTGYQVRFMQPDESWAKGGSSLNGWTLKAGNIATQSVQADTVYDSTTPEASMQLAVNDQITVAKYTTNSLGGSETQVTPDETFAPLQMAPLNLGNIELVRKPWFLDEIEHKPWMTGNYTGYNEVPDRPQTTDTTFSSIYTGTGTATIGIPNLVDSTTGTLALGPSQPQPYKGDSVEIIMPGNETYSYQDTNNNTVYQGQVEADKWYEPGSNEITKAGAETDATFTVGVDGTGKLNSIALATDGRFDNGNQQLRQLESPASQYNPPAPTPAELEDVWDTDDEWTTNGFNGAKEWPYHVTPRNAVINYNAPTIVNNSQSGVKYTRSVGHTKWRLEVEYPPMSVEDFQEFHAVAQAAHGQSTPFFFRLVDQYGGNILWRNMDGTPNTTSSPLLKTPIVAGDTTMLVEGFASNESNAFIRGEVFIDGNNENGFLHTSLSGTDSNIFGEAKIRTPWPFRSANATGNKVYKDPFHAVVTLADDNFEYQVDINGYYYVSVAFDLDGWK